MPSHLVRTFSPHAVSGLVLGVPVELRQSEHGLREDGGEPDALDEGVKVVEEVLWPDSIGLIYRPKMGPKNCPSIKKGPKMAQKITFKIAQMVFVLLNCLP